MIDQALYADGGHFNKGFAKLRASRSTSKRQMACFATKTYTSSFRCLLFLCGLIPAPALADKTIDLFAISTHAAAGFKQFLFSWAVPDNAVFSGLTGSVSIDTPVDSQNAALISVRWIPNGACPTNGEIYNSPRQIIQRYPRSQRLVQYILKRPTGGTNSIPVNFTVPGGVRISHCVYVVLDGGVRRGGPFTMKSSLRLHFNSDASQTISSSTILIGDEFCFGIRCGRRGTPDNTKSFAFYSRPFVTDAKLVSIHGNTVSTVISPDLIPIRGFQIPSGQWSVTHEVFVYRDCTGLLIGQAAAGDYYDNLPPDAVHIYSVTAHGKGLQSVNNMIDKDFTNVVIPKGGCLAHLVKRTGDGGINTEFQVVAFTRAAH